jgi:D-amino-acid oxidase
MSERRKRMAEKKAAVIGVGTIGLSTAMLALERGYHVTIYSDKPLSETTSMKAAASFKPVLVAENELTDRMLELSSGYFERIVMQDGEAAGVHKHVHWEAMSVPREPKGYLSMMEAFESVERPHVPGGYALGWKYRTFFIDTSIYLPWLLQRFTASGGMLVLLEKPFTSLEQLAELPADIVFNCTGLGARELCHDSKVIPIKGQVALTDPQPEINWSISADGFYMYPRRHNTVLGGTAEWRVNDEEVDPGAIDLIMRGNQRILPHLGADAIRKTYAGSRPYRADSIRVESENMNGKHIVHNYGHGGAGLTLCWGSAHLALELA